MVSDLPKLRDEQPGASGEYGNRGPCGLQNVRERAKLVTFILIRQPWLTFLPPGTIPLRGVVFLAGLLAAGRVGTATRVPRCLQRETR